MFVWVCVYTCICIYIYLYMFVPTTMCVYKQIPQFFIYIYIYEAYIKHIYDLILFLNSNKYSKKKKDEVYIQAVCCRFFFTKIHCKPQHTGKHHERSSKNRWPADWFYDKRFYFIIFPPTRKCLCFVGVGLEVPFFIFWQWKENFSFQNNNKQKQYFV